MNDLVDEKTGALLIDGQKSILRPGLPVSDFQKSELYLQSCDFYYSFEDGIIDMCQILHASVLKQDIHIFMHFMPDHKLSKLRLGFSKFQTEAELFAYREKYGFADINMKEIREEKEAYDAIMNQLFHDTHVEFPWGGMMSYYDSLIFDVGIMIRYNDDSCRQRKRWFRGMPWKKKY